MMMVRKIEEDSDDDGDEDRDNEGDEDSECIQHEHTVGDH